MKIFFSSSLISKCTNNFVNIAPFSFSVIIYFSYRISLYFLHFHAKNRIENLVICRIFENAHCIEVCRLCLKIFLIKETHLGPVLKYMYE